MPPPSSPLSSSSPIRSSPISRKRRRVSPTPDDRLTTMKSSSAKKGTPSSSIPSSEFYGTVSPPHMSDPTIVQGISHDPFRRSMSHSHTSDSARPITGAGVPGPSTSSDTKKRKIVTGKSQGVSLSMLGAQRTTRLMSLADMSFKSESAVTAATRSFSVLHC